MQKIIDKLATVLATFPQNWDGKTAILEMKNNLYPHWRQNEWIGFYFQYLCDNNLPKAGMKIPGTKFGSSKFDGNLCIDWDFKAHPIYNKNGKISPALILNDLEATVTTIDINRQTGLIVAQGIATFDDEDMTFRTWHKKLKGGDSKYSQENKARGATKRLYKTTFTVKHINIYLLNKNDVEEQGRFQKGMRNSNGKPRRDKLQVDSSTLTPIKTITL